ncbi:hypothetical protein QQP08_010590 [Theobroma cacao]|nr:hypothetical protein QQP08_010590 [Theobroma cacao]
MVKAFGPNGPELKGRWAFGLNRLACAGQLRWLPMERNHKPNFPISSFTQHQISVSTDGTKKRALTWVATWSISSSLLTLSSGVMTSPESFKS